MCGLLALLQWFVRDGKMELTLDMDRRKFSKHCNTDLNRTSHAYSSHEHVCKRRPNTKTHQYFPFYIGRKNF